MEVCNILYENIPYEEFLTNFLHPYEIACRHKEYRRIPLNIWTDLKTPPKTTTVTIRRVARTIFIWFNEIVRNYSFYDNDGALGEFIYNRYIIEERFDSSILVSNNNLNREVNNMKNNVFNFDFGPLSNNVNIRMSVYGLAVMNASGSFVSYDTNSMSLVNVDIFNFDGAKFLYKMPVAIKDIKVGDVIIHARKPMFVTGLVPDNKNLTVIDPVDGEVKTILLSRSPFGFDYATKIVNFFGDMNFGNATSDNPFGNLWMFMMMDENAKADNMLPFLLMSQNNNNNMNPMLLYALMSNNSTSESWLPFAMMLNMNQASVTPEQK